MNDLMLKAGLPKPRYEEIGSSFVVTFFKEESRKRGEGLNEGLKSVLKAIQNQPGVQAKELIEKLEGRPLKTIERQIKALMESKRIERRGSRKTGGYFIQKRDAVRGKTLETDS